MFPGMSDGEFEEAQRRQREEDERNAAGNSIAKWVGIWIWCSPVIAIVGYAITDWLT